MPRAGSYVRCGKDTYYDRRSPDEVIEDLNAGPTKRFIQLQHFVDGREGDWIHPDHVTAVGVYFWRDKDELNDRPKNV